ncbi:MAG: RlmE family RNA methyltransferase [Deltaproteobacteria bacterium]|nr:RlmE family RNA methyltransferase [Deltaproteobacteria bacterium]
MKKRRRAQDHFARRAKQENYPARSVYKLEEIDQRVRLIRRGDTVLDLGAAPGSWTLYAAEKVGTGGAVVAIDRASLSVGVPANVTVIEADALACDPNEIRGFGAESGFDVVISDMAPKTSGHRFVDQSRSYALFSRALEIGAELLRPGGRFTGKIFHGEDFEKAREQLRELFTKVKVVRPKSVRSESYEIYLVGLDRKQR